MRNSRSVALAIGFAVLFFAPSRALAQTLGSAQSFAVVGGSAVTAAGTGTVITGDVGVSPGTSITGFPAGATVVAPFATHANDAAAMAAQSAVTSLYASLVGGASTPLAMELGGTTVTPGTYSFGSTANIAAGTNLTLSGNGTYIFQVGSAITANVLSNVLLTNGASACNVFWQVTSAATLNGISFAGNVVAQAGISLGPSAQLTGRALATSAGPVTMAGNNSIGGCSAPPPPVCPSITLAPTTLPGGTVGVAYSQTIVGSGGTAPYSFGVIAGALPAGVTLTAAGVLAGTPTTAGTSHVHDPWHRRECLCRQRRLHDRDRRRSAAPTGVSVDHTRSDDVARWHSRRCLQPDDRRQRRNRAVQLRRHGRRAAGRRHPHRGWCARGHADHRGTSPFTIRGTDANACVASVAFTIVIAAAPPPPPVCPSITLAPTTLPGGTVGVAYSQTIVGSGGTAPYSFGVMAGALPAGVTLTAAGVLAGTPTTVGTSPFTIRGTDANACVASVAFTIVIAAAPPPPPVCPSITLAPTTLPGGTVGVAYSQTIVGSGGTAPYSFGVIAGALPASVTLTAAGVLAGTPTTVGTSPTIRGTDANACVASDAFTVAITSGVPPVPTLPQALIVLLALGLLGIGWLRLRRV